MINLDVAEFHIGVIEAAGYKSVTVDCAMMRELITRLRKTEKDAARYRWLRDAGCFEGSADDLFHATPADTDAEFDRLMKCDGDNK